jgi:hypothetical protein
MIVTELIRKNGRLSLNKSVIYKKGATMCSTTNSGNWSAVTWSSCSGTLPSPTDNVNFFILINC